MHVWKEGNVKIMKYTNDEDQKEEENLAKGEKIRVQCATCKNENEHRVVMSFDTSGIEPYFDGVHEEPRGNIYWSNSYQIIKCGGCQSVSFRRKAFFSEDQTEDDDGTSETLFPPRSRDMLQAKDFYNAPRSLRRIYHEVVEAFNRECYTLCAGGLRAIVEGICADNNVKKGPVEVTEKGAKVVRQKENLEGKISGLREKGILTKRGADLLHSHRFLGNDALHDLEMPSVAELRLALDIIEHVLTDLYELPDKGNEIEWRRKQRKTGKPPTLADHLRGKRLS